MKPILAKFAAACAVIATLSVAVSAAAGAQKTTGKAAADQTLTVTQAFAPFILDPAFFGNYNYFTMEDNLFTRLTQLDPKSQAVKPSLATSWKSASGGRVWTFHLRHDATFSNGKPITSAEVRYSLVRAFTPISASEKASLGVINVVPTGLSVIPELVGAEAVTNGKAKTIPASAISAPDKYTVVVRLVSPRSDLLQRLAHPSLGIVEPANVKTSTASKPWWQHAVSSGPFMISSLSPNVSATLVPNRRYWGAKPILKRVVFKVITDVQTAELAYEDGKVDFVKTLSQNVLNLKGKFNNQVRGQISNVVTDLDIEHNAVTKDPHVVKALWLALDQKTIANTVLAGLVRPAWTFTPPQWPGYSTKGFKPITFDPSAAKAELAKSGLNPSSITIRLVWTPGLDPRGPQALAQLWQQTLGVKVLLIPWESRPPNNAAPEDAANVIIDQQGPNFVSPCSMVQRFKDMLVTAPGAGNANINPNPAIEPELDKGLDACYAAPPSTVWSKVMALETLNQQIPIFIPFLWNVDYYLVKSYVKNLVLGSNWNIANLSQVSIAPH